MTICGLRFRISGQPYRQILDWQANIDHSILIHQLRTRGQALVTKRLVEQAAPALNGSALNGSSDTVLKIRDLPEQGAYQPYYGTNGAYRFTFQPMVEGCRLEVYNQMGGFAFYAPDRIDPLNLYLFQPVEEVTCAMDVFKDAPLQPENDPPMFEHDCESGQLVFTLLGQPYRNFTNWAWSRRALHAYHFIFTPTHDGCETRVFARESGVTLDLTSQDTL